MNWKLRVRKYSWGLIGRLEAFFCRIALISVGKPDQLPVPDMQNHLLHWLEREFRKENFFMPEVSLVTSDLSAAFISAKAFFLCVSYYLCDSLWCTDSDVQNALHLPWQPRLRGFCSEPMGGCAGTTAGKSKALELWNLFHISIFLPLAGVHQLSFVKYAQQCYCTNHSEDVWINLLIFSNN